MNGFFGIIFLLAHGPRQNSNGLGHVSRYRSFVHNCKAGKEAEEMSTLQPLLEADGNWSLARCAVQHLVERRILELKAIFVTIPVSFVIQWREGFFAFSKLRRRNFFLETYLSDKFKTMNVKISLGVSLANRQKRAAK